MKKIIILLSLVTITSVLFAEKEREKSLDFGIGIFYRNNLYKQKDENQILPLPVIGARYNKFYYEAPIELGYHFYDADDLTFTVYGRYNLYSGYKPKDMIKEYKDMDKRKDDFHLGLRSNYKFGSRNTRLITYVSGDISEVSDGFLAKAELDQPVVINERIIVIPYIGVGYMSRQYADYYFGIKESETLKGINRGREYKADEAFEFETGVRSIISVSKNLKVFMNADYKRYGNSIADSPLVKNRNIYTLGTGMSYSFKF